MTKPILFILKLNETRKTIPTSQAGNVDNEELVCVSNGRQTGAFL